MLDLIERLEKAEAGSQELDAVFARVVAKPNTMLNGMSYDEALDRFPNDLVGIARNWPIPFYTTSLDAIVALIGEKLLGCEWSVSEDESRAVAWVNGSKAWANTPALALCIALLRSLQNKEGCDVR